jgi:DNA-binding GntR family transcriptional regulator
MPREASAANEKILASGTAAKRRRGLTDRRIYSEIYSAIINHQLRPATALQEDALAKAFGVSRTVIRKVLHRLAHERLVELYPNRGAFVAKPSIEEARQIFEARRAAECFIIEKLVFTISDEDIAKLATIVKAEALALGDGKNRRRVKLSGKFHRELAALVGNDVLRNFVNELVSRTSLIIALYESPGAVPCSYNEHIEIMDALKRRDGKKAVQYMEHHLRHVEAQIELVDHSNGVDFSALFRPVG